MNKCKYVIPFCFAALALVGCFGPVTFDATDSVSIKESANSIAATLPESERAEFTKAIMYFSVGGSDGFKSMLGAAMGGKKSPGMDETVMSANLMAIDGLTGPQILSKYEAKMAEVEKAAKVSRQVSQLKNEADMLLRNDEFQAALAKYQALSEYTEGVDSAKAGIEKATAKMEAISRKMEYIQKVEIMEFETKRMDTFSKKDVPAVRLSLKNTGNRSLDKVEVAVYFKDESGAVIFEEDFLPVLVSSYSTRNNKPLKAGYVHEMKKGSYYTLDTPLTAWKEGSATVKIVDIEFSDES